MKIILAPTDFSKTARVAVNYAAEIAKRTKASLVLLHAYHPPVIIAEAPIVLPLPADLEKESMRRMKKIRYDLITKHGRKLDVTLVCMNGFATEVIEKYAKTNKADLIVLGTHGLGYFEKVLLGSVTSELIKNSKTPVLSIPVKAKFKSIKKIVLATDFQKFENKATLNLLKDFAGLFKSHIYILNVLEKANAYPTVSMAVQGLKLDHLLEEQDHSFHIGINKSVVKGINEFVEEQKMDLIMMLPRRRSFFDGILKKSNSKEMAFHTETPLLTIHI